MKLHSPFRGTFGLALCLGFVFVIGDSSNAQEETGTAEQENESSEARHSRSKVSKQDRLLARAEKIIRAQLKSRRLTKRNKNEYRREADSFIIAKIDVPLQSNTADVCFESVSSIKAGTDRIMEFMKETPDGNWRDFRVISRYREFEDAESSLADVRVQYDRYKEQEAQMLAYMQARNRALAHVSRTRRC